MGPDTRLPTPASPRASGVPVEKEWSTRFRYAGAKLLESLERAVEEHLQQQERLVCHILSGSGQEVSGVKPEESANSECAPEEGRHLNVLEEWDVPAVAHYMSSGPDCTSNLRGYLQSEMANLTAGIMSVYERAPTAALISGTSSRSLVQRAADTYRSFHEPPRTGLLARIVTSSQFEILTFVVIAAYGVFAVWMTNALMAQPEIEDAPAVAGIETFFLTFFLTELVARLLVHRLYYFFNADMGWNWLDFLIIVFSLVDVALNFFMPNGSTLKDVNYVRIVRALRISKSLRILRAVRFVNELRVLVNCIVTSFTVLVPCVVLLLLILAGVSTALVQLVVGYVQEHRGQEGNAHVELLEEQFGTVQAAMMSLFMSTTGGVNWGEHYSLMSQAGTLARFVYMAYVLFFFVAAWNIITSLFMEKAMALSQPGIEAQMLRKHREDMQHAGEIVKILEETDHHGSGTISLSRFKEYMENPRFRYFFECRDLDIKDAEMFFRILSSVSASKDVKYDTFAYGCMRMKGYASSLDVQCLRTELKAMHLNQGKIFKFLFEELGSIKARVQTRQELRVCAAARLTARKGSPQEHGEAPKTVAAESSKGNCPTSL